MEVTRIRKGIAFEEDGFALRPSISQDCPVQKTTTFY